jgi:hypothetical protein
MLSQTAGGAIDMADEANADTPTDHHLDEIAEMISRARAEGSSPDRPSGQYAGVGRIRWR